ncbi:uncharacterized protein [Rhodnius prolixus]|uniref:uncharacterized protein n=1 Tax=Rhodnius prolixus TaxID=13249 RepID=UPI003D188287
MESRKSDIDGNCTFCHSKHCNNRPEEPISKNWSTYGTDFTTPIKDAGYYNYYMANYGLLKNKKHSRRPYNYQDMEKSGMITVYLNDYRPHLPDPTKQYLDKYDPGKRCNICVKHDVPIKEIKKATTKDEFALREEMVELYSNRFNSFRRETMERSQDANLLKDRSYEWFSGLRTNKS